ncbi:YDG domain-containing protein [Christensenellaceae bacterium OttesenSCG-928-M15]|nr:YDG domain-containing protein [Christensenellaceae bacterium OttesenSCG-928-M15]
MNRFTRFVAGLLAAVLICGCVALPQKEAQAAENEVVVLKVTSTRNELLKGESVTINVSIDGPIQRFESLRVLVKYNTSKFELDVSEGAVNSIADRLKNDNFEGTRSMPSGSGAVGYEIKNNRPTSNSNRKSLELTAGLLFSLTFKLRSTYVNGPADFSTTDLPDAYKPVFSYYVDTSTDELATIPYIGNYFVTVVASGGSDPAMNNWSVNITNTEDGKPVAVGETLIANVANNPPEAKLSYQWYQYWNGAQKAIAGATSPTYTMTADDAGKYMRVEVQAEGYSGKLVNTLNTVVERAEQTDTVGEQHINPILVEATYIQFEKKAGIEFNVSTSETPPELGWDESMVAGLTPDTPYYAFARYAGTAGTKPGPYTQYKDPASQPKDTIRTLKETQRLAFVITPKDGGTVNYDISQGPPATEGKTIYLTAKPAEGYYFVKWDGGKELTGEYAIDNVTYPTGASFKMPAAYVTIEAAFAEKANPYIVFVKFEGEETDPQVKPVYTEEYTGAPIKIPDPKLYGDVEGDPDEIVVAYWLDGEELTGPPTDCGVYTVVASYKGDAKNNACEASTTLTITPVKPPEPTAPVVKLRELTRIGFETVAGQRYLIRLSSEGDSPSLESSKWFDGTGSVHIEENLLPAREYTIFTYIPASTNNTISAIIKVRTSTVFNWKLTPLLNNKICTDVTFQAKENVQPSAKTIMIRNDSEGKIQGLRVSLSSETYFVLGTGSTATSLPVNGTTTFTIQPKEGQPGGKYTATILINAMPNEAGETEPFETIEIPVTFEVSDKIPVDIGGLEDKTAVYDGNQHKVKDAEYASAQEGSSIGLLEQLQYWYEGYGDTDYERTLQPPVKAGEYVVTVMLPETNTTHAGRETARLTIEKRPLSLEGLEVKSRTYDGTTIAQLTGGRLANIVNNDEVEIDGGIPTTGRFVSKNQGTRAVVIDNLVLAGADKGNYVFTQPNLSGMIGVKAVMPTIPHVEKMYDNSYLVKDDVIATFAENAVCDGDELTVIYSGCSVDNKNVGSDRVLTPGVATITGNKDKNYNILEPQASTATIIPCEVDVTVSGEAEVEYDGRPKSLKGTYPAFTGDTPRVTVYYNGEPSAPTLAGEYLITARVEDPNYTCVNVIGVEKLTIRYANLTWTDISRMVVPGDTQVRTVPLADFQVRPSYGSANVEGDYKIENVIDDKELLEPGILAITNDGVRFKLKDNGELGDQITIGVRFTPKDNTYSSIVMQLLIFIAEEGYTCTILNAPKTVNLGEDIDLTNVKLKTVFDSGKPTEEVPVTEAMISGEYDKDAKGKTALGEKHVIITYPGTPQRRATFNIEVLDVVIDYTVAAPTKLKYDWMVEKTLDLTGGYLTPSMQSNELGVAIPMTGSMLNVTNTTLERLGTHAVHVTYSRITKKDQFVIEVVTVANPITENPPGGQPGVINLDPDTTFARDDGTVVQPQHISLVVDDASAEDKQRLQAAVEENEAFKDIPNENIVMMDISLRDDSGAKVYPSKAIRIRIPYPARAGNTNKFTVLHLPDKDNTLLYSPANADGGMEFTVDSMSPFAVGWATASSGGDGDGDGDDGSNSGTSGGSGGGSGGKSPSADRAKAFWDSVLKSIQSAKNKSVIRADAKSYDQMPVAVMEAMTKKDVTLVISWDGGSDIVITKSTAFTPESTRKYFPLSLLADLYPTDPPKTDDPEEGEAWLREQNAKESAATKPSSSSSSSSGSSSSSSSSSKGTSTVKRPNTAEERQKLADAFVLRALEQAEEEGADVVDVVAPNIEEDRRTEVTPKNEGWSLSSAGSAPAAVRPVINLPEGYNKPGLTALLVLLGAIALLGGAAVLLFMRKNRLVEDDDE